jgi:predicted porin
MKKTLIALAALAATGAFAQSSVSLTGGLDAGVMRSAGATSVNTISAPGTNLTFTAVEDLGAGLKATAFVNVRFNPATGQNTSNGAADPATDGFAQNVSFAVDGGFGQIKAGRFTGVIQGPIGNFDPFGTDDTGVVITGALVPVRNNGMVAYTTPSFAGLKGAVQWTAKTNNAGATKNGVEGVVLYNNGPIAALAGITQTLTDTKATSLAASYDLGFVKPMFAYAKNDNGSAANTKQTAIGLTAPFGAFLVKAGYRVTDTDGAAEVKRNSLGVTYTLSKRTSLIADTWDQNGATERSYYVGVRHTF